MPTKYCFFPPRVGPIDTDQGELGYCQEGAYAYQRNSTQWYVWKVDHSTEAFTESWHPIPASLVPAEHRAYILLNP